MRLPFNPVWMLCALLGSWALLVLPLIKVAPNRLMSGAPVFLADLLHGQGALVWLLPVLLGILGWAQQSRFAASSAWHKTSIHGAAMAIVAVLIASLLWLAGKHASQIAISESLYARTSLGAGFWCLLILAILLGLDIVAHLARAGVQRSLWLCLLALPSVLVIVLGMADDLSVMKEYANRSDVFWLAMLRHIQIVAIAIVPSVLLSLPLAWGCSRLPAWQAVMFPLLNIIQTIPSIALFGLLMAPLAWAAAQFPWLGRAGISGVGLAPAALALILYSLLPIVRSALAGLQQVPLAATTAAQAMGMSAWQIFYQIELPLALPVLLPGLRTAVVQTIGLAAVTALVGAGGLGAMMFEGLFSAANELVLLGVLPIVVMAVLADTVFKALTVLADPMRSSRRPTVRTVVTLKVIA